MRSRPRTFVAAALALTVALLAMGCSKDEAARPKKTTTTEAERTTTSAAPTTTAPAPAVAPLTGLPVAAGQELKVLRPALAIKIDNSPEALPQSGVNNTDIVYEIQVEGISRLMAIFQSNDAEKVGPTRSARFSDPPILAMFGKPMFGWSGANKRVAAAVKGSPFINNVQWEVEPGEYKRSRDRKAPHNLYTNTNLLYGHIGQGEGTPPQQFQYLGAGESNASATPAGGVNLKVGTTPSTWAWNPAVGQYLRWEYGRRHGTTDAGQVWANNVVILATQYSKGPVAITTGAGPALILTGGTAVSGVWTRAEQTQPYTLTAADGSTIKLTPGRTWVELPNHPWTVIGQDVASGLLAGG
jgi:hypothetical protein